MMNRTEQNRTEQNRTEHFLTLDAARGIAALCVFIYHLKTFVFPEFLPQFPSLLSKSYLAVDLFFLMSGLVIAKAYASRLLSGRMTFKSFFIKRLIRLYPLYIAGLSLGFGYELFKWVLNMGEDFNIVDMMIAFIINGVFLPDYFSNIGIFSLDPAAWSLSLEWLFNLIFALILYKYTGKYLLALILTSALSLVFLAISAGSLDLGWHGSNFHGGFIRIVFSFSLGVYIFSLIEQRKLKIKSLNTFFLLLPVTIVIINPIGIDSVFYDLFTVFVVFPLFVLLGCFSKPSSPLISRVSIFSGDISYALYILHTPLILWIAGFWKFIVKDDPAAMPMISFPLIMITTILISYVATEFFDKIVRKYLNQRIKSWH